LGAWPCNAVERLGQLAPRVAPEQPHLALVAPAQAAQHPQRSRLAGAVSAEKPGDVAGRRANPAPSTRRCGQSA
jgi:hypothetical protein